MGLRGGIMTGMTTRQDELSEFLKSRRARLAPADVGLAAARNGRRVTGLRREELAMLAGVSPDYYARLEQGRAANVSEQVLDAVAATMVRCSRASSLPSVSVTASALSRRADCSIAL